MTTSFEIGPSDADRQTELLKRLRAGDVTACECAAGEIELLQHCLDDAWGLARKYQKAALSLSHSALRKSGVLAELEGGA